MPNYRTLVLVYFIAFLTSFYVLGCRDAKEDGCRGPLARVEVNCVPQPPALAEADVEDSDIHIWRWRLKRRRHWYGYYLLEQRK